MARILLRRCSFGTFPTNPYRGARGSVAIFHATLSGIRGGGFIREFKLANYWKQLNTVGVEQRPVHCTQPAVANGNCVASHAPVAFGEGAHSLAAGSDTCTVLFNQQTNQRGFMETPLNWGAITNQITASDADCSARCTAQVECTPPLAHNSLPLQPLLCDVDGSVPGCVLPHTDLLCLLCKLNHVVHNHWVAGTVWSRNKVNMQCKLGMQGGEIRFQLNTDTNSGLRCEGTKRVFDKVASRTGESHVQHLAKYTDVGDVEFNKAFAGSQTKIIARTCTSCSEHKLIFYKRLTPIPQGWSLLQNLVTTWTDTNNKMGTDFTLHFSRADAESGLNPWKHCDYNKLNVGFPANCGPNGQ